MLIDKKSHMRHVDTPSIFVPQHTDQQCWNVDRHVDCSVDVPYWNSLWKQNCIAWEMNISALSVSRILHNDLYLDAYRRSVNRLLNAGLKEQQLFWCGNLLKWFWKNRHYDILFIDVFLHQRKRKSTEWLGIDKKLFWSPRTSCPNPGRCFVLCCDRNSFLQDRSENWLKTVLQHVWLSRWITQYPSWKP